MLLLVVLVSHFVVVFCATLSQFPSQKETVEAWIWNRKWDKMRETIEGWETWLKGIENENRLLPNSKPLYGPKWAKSRPWSPDSRRDEIIFCYVIFYLWALSLRLNRALFDGYASSKSAIIAMMPSCLGQSNENRPLWTEHSCWQCFWRRRHRRHRKYVSC